MWPEWNWGGGVVSPSTVGGNGVSDAHGDISRAISSSSALKYKLELQSPHF